MALLPERMKKFKSKIRALELLQSFSLILRRSRAANSKVVDGIFMSKLLL